MKSLDAFAARKLQDIADAGQTRRIVPTERGDAMALQRGGRNLISFCDNDYLGLSQNEHVKAAAVAAALEYGAGGGASRLITGSYPLLHELEDALADWKETEDCVVFGSGYMTNIGVIPTLVGPEDAILIDELSHNCMHAGAFQSRAQVIRYRHNDLTDLERKLESEAGNARQVLVLSDGVFSMDGDLAPAAELGDLARRHDAWLMTDDAHGLGALAEGKGSVFATGNSADVPLQMGTLSKAVGAYGGYLCASSPVCDLIRNRARSLVYTTALPPAAAGAALAAMKIIKADPDLCAAPMLKARRFAARIGLDEPASPIVPMIIGDEGSTMALSENLMEHGFLVSGIRPPTVPAGTSRLRFTFSATHRDEDVDRLAALVAQVKVS